MAGFSSAPLGHNGLILHVDLTGLITSIIMDLTETRQLHSIVLLLQVLYENGVNGILADEMGLGKKEERGAA